MKKLISPILVAIVILLPACHSKTKTADIDIVAVKSMVASLLDNFHSSMQAKDAVKYMSLLAADGLYCGTDSKELMGQTELAETVNQEFANMKDLPKYSISTREIRVSADGNSAIAMDQFTFPLYSEKMPIRVIFHAIKIGTEWKIDFFSWSFIPNNQDIPKLNEALK